MLYVSASFFNVTDCVFRSNVASVEGAVLRYFGAGADGRRAVFARVVLIDNIGPTTVDFVSPMTWYCQVSARRPIAACRSLLFALTIAQSF